MNFNAPSDVNGWLLGNGLVGLCPETQNLITCMDMLSRMCPCDSSDAKTKRFNQCKQHYIAFASRAQSFSPQLFSKAPNENKFCFFLNNQLLSSVTR